jgi:hypothetical protein
MLLPFLLVTVTESLRAQTDVRSFIVVTPSSLTFSSPDPDSMIASASSSATWRLRFANATRTWQLRVNATSASVSNCGQVPLTAFRVSCNAVNVAKGGTGVCSGPIVLSDSPQTVASGNQGDHNYNSTADIQVQFVDSWQYPAKVSPACSLILAFTVEAQ